MYSARKMILIVPEVTEKNEKANNNNSTYY